jgi:sulfite reductase beta subunit-like hemoprotein
MILPFQKGCVSCTGIEFCNLAVAETKNRMIELINQLETTSGWYKDKIRVHFGMSLQLQQHQIADIDFAVQKPRSLERWWTPMTSSSGTSRQRTAQSASQGKILAADVHLVIDSLLKLSRRATGRRNFQRIPFAQSEEGSSRSVAGTLSRLRTEEKVRTRRSARNLT